ncbi:MAG: Fur family transcriptional regulator [Staphylococcus epidermidis]|nr:Fur family transcriptional regulator [Staphylococcus epidermidis]
MSAELESIDHELEESIASLRKAGVRITPQRQAIMRYLISSHSHPTADEIYQALSPKFPNISVATIYNNLRVFKDIGIVKELTYGDSHYPQLDEVEQLAQHVTDFDVTHHRMEIYGVCKECKEEGN